VLFRSTSYTFELFSTNDRGNSLTAAIITKIPSSVPDLIHDLICVPGRGACTLTWTIPDDNGSAITSYEVYKKENTNNMYILLSGVVIQSTSTDTKTTIISSLTNGIEVSFYIKAINDNGSSISNIVTETPADVPTMNTIRAGHDLNNQATVEWTLGSNGGSNLIKYVITCTPFPVTTKIINNISTTATTVSKDITNILDTRTIITGDDGLISQFTYTFSIKALNGIGFSQVITTDIIILGSIPIAPTKPTITTSALSGTLRVSFNYRGNINTKVLSHFIISATSNTTPPVTITKRIEYQTSMGTNLNNDFTVLSNFDNLTNGTSYTFTAQSCNILGDSPKSTSSDPAIPYAVPSTPIINNIIFNDRSATIYWTEPDKGGYAALSHYSRQFTSPESARTTIPLSTVVASPNNDLLKSFTFTNLINGRSYILEFRAHNTKGPSEPAIIDLDLLKPPNPPTNLTATIESTSTRLSWGPPTWDGSSPIQSYTVNQHNGNSIIALDPNVYPIQTTQGSNIMFTNITGLTNYVTYFYSVKCTNAIGTSINSSIVQIMPGVPPGDIDANSIILSQDDDNDMINISWSKPINRGYIDGGYSIHSYKITSNPLDVVNYSVSSDPVTTDAPLSIEMNGLSIRNTYTFTVQAISNAGTSNAVRSVSSIEYRDIISTVNLVKLYTFDNISNNINNNKFINKATDSTDDSRYDLTLIGNPFRYVNYLDPNGQPFDRAIDGWDVFDSAQAYTPKHGNGLLKLYNYNINAATGTQVEISLANSSSGTNIAAYFDYTFDHIPSATVTTKFTISYWYKIPVVKPNTNIQFLGCSTNIYNMSDNNPNLYNDAYAAIEYRRVTSMVNGSRWGNRTTMYSFNSSVTSDQQQFPGYERNTRGKWQHFALVYNSDITGGSKWKKYVNGIERLESRFGEFYVPTNAADDDSNVICYSGSNSLTSRINFKRNIRVSFGCEISKSLTFNQRNTEFQIDSIRFYSTDLTVNDIRTLADYNRNQPTTNGLVFHLKFDNEDALGEDTITSPILNLINTNCSSQIRYRIFGNSSLSFSQNAFMSLDNNRYIRFGDGSMGSTFSFWVRLTSHIGNNADSATVPKAITNNIILGIQGYVYLSFHKLYVDGFNYKIIVRVNGNVPMFGIGTESNGLIDYNMRLKWWYNVAVVVNTTSWKIYIDGILQQTVSLTNEQSSMFKESNPNETVLGNTHTLYTSINNGPEALSMNRSMNEGFIDCVRVYNRQLTDTELDKVLFESNYVE
jgi:hypothetical protein